MTTKTTKTTGARKSAKKSATKTPAPRKRDKSKVAIHDATLEATIAPGLAEAANEFLKANTKRPAPKRSRKQAVEPKETPPAPAEVGKPTTRLIRTFKGREIVVDIVEGKYIYEGETFTSISAVAKHIVGYGISGPHFFKLDTPKAAAEGK